MAASSACNWAKSAYLRIYLFVSLAWHLYSCYYYIVPSTWHLSLLLCILLFIFFSFSFFFCGYDLWVINIMTLGFRKGIEDCTVSESDNVMIDSLNLVELPERIDDLWSHWSPFSFSLSFFFTWFAFLGFHMAVPVALIQQGLHCVASVSLYILRNAFITESIKHLSLSSAKSQDFIYFFCCCVESITQGWVLCAAVSATCGKYNLYALLLTTELFGFVFLEGTGR